MRLATACAVFAALTVAGCSAGHSTPAAERLSTSVAAGLSSSSGAGVSSSAAGSGGSAGAGSTAAAGSAGTGSAASPGPANPADPADPEDSAAATAKPETVAGNITIAPAGTLKPGPFTITPLYCGKLTAAQQQQFGTTAAGGLIYRYVNGSAATNGDPKLYVAFNDGAAVAGENYGGNLPDIGAGQSAEGEVDAVGITNQDLNFTSCEVMSYALVTSSGVDPVSYAG
jgi:hypothetical protein